MTIPPFPRPRLIASCDAPAPAARQNRGFAPVDGRGRTRQAVRAAGTPTPRLPDPAIWRTEFPAIWRAFLMARWGDDAIGIAAAFGVRVQTARNWLSGLHRPTGDVAARAMLAWRAEILPAALRVGGGL